ncbi:MAG: hypothetical protein ABIN58_07860, partial [candidate division WOR-3 bacterium]
MGSVRIRHFLDRIGGQFLASLFLVVLSGWTAREAYRMGLGRLHAPGPGFMVFIAAVVLGALALYMLARSLSEGSRIATLTEAGKGRRKTALVFVVLAASAALFEIVG